MRDSTSSAIRRLMLLGALAALTSGCVIHAPAPVVVGTPRPIVVRTAPPPPPRRAVVVAPVARPGYVFVRGHYRWRGNGWVWFSHRYVPVRSGHYYVQPRYDSGRGVYVGGHWMRGTRRARPPRRAVRRAPPTVTRRAPPPRRGAPPPPPTPPR